MKTKMSQAVCPTMPPLNATAVINTIASSLPKLEDLPESNRQELVRALVALLLHDPELQAVLEVRYEPKQ